MNKQLKMSCNQKRFWKQNPYPNNNCWYQKLCWAAWCMAQRRTYHQQNYEIILSKLQSAVRPRHPKPITLDAIMRIFGGALSGYLAFAMISHDFWFFFLSFHTTCQKTNLLLFFPLQINAPKSRNCERTCFLAFCIRFNIWDNEAAVLTKNVEFIRLR